MARKRLVLPKRFNAAMTDEAYRRLRDLNQEWNFGNNYLLTIILENFDVIVDDTAWRRVMDDFIAEYGQPLAGT